MGAFNPMDFFNAGGELGKANASPFTYGSQNVMDQFKMGQQLQMQLAGQLGLKNAENQLPLNPTDQKLKDSETSKNVAIGKSFGGDGSGNQLTYDANGNPLITGGLKQQQFKLQQAKFDSDQWKNVVTDTDASKASSRTTLGMGAQGNLLADRARNTLMKKLVTNQDANYVFNDISRLYEGGPPSDTGIEHGTYNSIQQQLATLPQYLSGKPTDALPDATKQHLIGVLDDLKNSGNAMIQKHFDFYEAAHPEIIQKHGPQWQLMKQSMMPAQQNPNPLQNAASGNNDEALVAQALRSHTDPAQQKAILATYKQRTGKEYGK